MHHKRLWRNGTTEPKRIQVPSGTWTGKICRFDGCDRTVTAKGYCTPHAEQLKKGQELRPLRIYRQMTPGGRGARDHRLWNRYGIDSATYGEMLRSQEGRCAICGSEADQCKDGVLLVDHDHATDAVRELLCTRCNTLLAMCNDNPGILSAGIQYLGRHAAPMIA